MRLGDLLRATRKASGIKIRALARELGVSHSYLIAIEQNKKPASERVLKLLSKALGIPEQMRDFYRCEWCGKCLPKEAK